MNFDFTDDQQAIKRTAKDLLAEPLQAREGPRARRGGRPTTTRIWNEMLRARLARHLHRRGARRPGARHGRAGDPAGGARLRARAGARSSRTPPPGWIQYAGTDEQQARWLPGHRVGRGARHRRARSRTARRALVPDAETADVIVLVDGDGGSVVERCGRVEVEPIETIDTTRRFARVTAKRRASRSPATPGAGARPHRRRARRRARRRRPAHAWRWPSSTPRTASSSTARSAPTRASRTAARRCCSRSRARASLTYYAAWAADAEPETLPLAASMAKAYASDAGWRVTASSLQVHGGIGFTWEHDLHFFLKRGQDGRAPVRRRARAPRARRRAGDGRRRRAGLAAVSRPPTNCVTPATRCSISPKSALLRAP